jgi:hypothetical protein
VSLREFLRERELLLFLAAIAALFIAFGVFFRVPGPRQDRQIDDAPTKTLRQLGLEDPSQPSERGRTLPGVLEDWNHQLLIGH